MGAGDWTCIVTGDVASVEREDVDKSGRNPKWFYEFVVNAVAVEGLPEGRHLPPAVTFRVAGAELERLKVAPPEVGEHVIVTARGNGPSPELFAVNGLKRA